MARHEMPVKCGVEPEPEISQVTKEKAFRYAGDT